MFPRLAPVVRMWFEYFVPTDANVTDLLGVVVAAREYVPSECNATELIRRAALRVLVGCQASLFCSARLARST